LVEVLKVGKMDELQVAHESTEIGHRIKSVMFFVELNSHVIQLAKESHFL
jgi:hypothetical protein